MSYPNENIYTLYNKAITRIAELEGAIQYYLEVVDDEEKFKDALFHLAALVGKPKEEQKP